MNKFFLGKKLGMTQVFNENGNIIPVTVVETSPCTVVQLKTEETDGYVAVKVGYENILERKLNKPEKGLFAKNKIAPKKFLKEFRVDSVENYQVGQDLKISEMFENGEKIDITGISKGKGFQGVIKRYGHARGKETHGSMYHRRVGSMGACSTPGRVFKGKKLPGHMGNEKVTVQNLELVKIDNDRNIILVKGAVPGPKGAYLVIKGAVKAGK